MTEPMKHRGPKRSTRSKQAQHDVRITPRIRAFVEAYLGEAQANGKRAAQIAGYTGGENSLKVRASRLLASPSVQEELERQRAEVTSERIMTKKRRQELLSEFAENREAEMKDRIKAIEVLGKMHGDFVEKHEVEHKGAAVVVRFPRRDP